MKKLSSNDAGFSAVELILVVVIVALIGVVGYMVYKNHHKTIASPVATVATTKYPTTSPTNAPTSSSSDTKYLTITQWGVRAPYTSMDSLSYAISSSDSSLAVIISKNMSDNYGCTGANDLPSGAGGIYRGLASAVDDSGDSPSPMTYAQEAQQDSTDYKQVGNYVYVFAHDQAACQAHPTAAGGAAQTQAENFTNSLIPKLEATP